MSTSENTPSRQSNNLTQFMLTILTTAIVVGIVVWFFRPGVTPTPEPTIMVPTEDWPVAVSSDVTATPTLTPIATPLPTETPTPLPTPTPIVIGSFSELGTFISLEATLQTIVELEKERTFPLSPERILLSAVGNVEAGIDLTEVDQRSITIDRTSVKIVLPRAQVTSVELLPNETEIFDSQQGWVLSEYQGLEIEALDKARRQLEDWAVKRNNLLGRAEDEAKEQLEGFLRKLGFEEVVITYEEE